MQKHYIKLARNTARNQYWASYEDGQITCQVLHQSTTVYVLVTLATLLPIFRWASKEKGDTG